MGRGAAAGGPAGSWSRASAKYEDLKAALDANFDRQEEVCKAYPRPNPNPNLNLQSDFIIRHPPLVLVLCGCHRL